MTQLAIIVAAANNWAIGIDNTLPWHLPEDLQHFKRITLGKPIIMGRKTFDSIGRPLPGRTNIVVTRQADWQASGVKAVTSIKQALAVAKSQAMLDGVDEVMLIGGAELYREALPMVDRIYLTKVHTVVDGDAFFPEPDMNIWEQVQCEGHTAAGDASLTYEFCVLQRRG